MIKFVVILLAIVLGTPAYAQDMPSFELPPAGYSWYSLPDTEVAVLRPDGWFVKAVIQDGTNAFFISKEDIDTAGEFQTGFSLNFIRDIKVKSGFTASEYAYVFLSEALEGNEELTSFGDSSNGLVSLGLRIKMQKIDRVIHYYLVANDDHDTLHIFMFEAPIEEWDAAWKVGEPMFRDLRLIFPG